MRSELNHRLALTLRYMLQVEVGIRGILAEDHDGRGRCLRLLPRVLKFRHVKCIFSILSLFLDLRMQDLVVVVEVLGEARGWQILDLCIEDVRDR